MMVVDHAECSTHAHDCGVGPGLGHDETAKEAWVGFTKSEAMVLSILDNPVEGDQLKTDGTLPFYAVYDDANESAIYVSFPAPCQHRGGQLSICPAIG